MVRSVYVHADLPSDIHNILCSFYITGITPQGPYFDEVMNFSGLFTLHRSLIAPEHYLGEGGLDGN